MPLEYVVGLEVGNRDYEATSRANSSLLCWSTFYFMGSALFSLLIRLNMVEFLKFGFSVFPPLRSFDSFMVTNLAVPSRLD